MRSGSTNMYTDPNKQIQTQTRAHTHTHTYTHTHTHARTHTHTQTHRHTKHGTAHVLRVCTFVGFPDSAIREEKAMKRRTSAMTLEKSQYRHVHSRVSIMCAVTAVFETQTRS